MITVNILINGQPIFTRSAVRTAGKPGGLCAYKLDDGSTLTHEYDHGAVKLAMKMLKTIREPRQDNSAT